jgi:hypothetical protein
LGDTLVDSPPENREDADGRSQIAKQDIIVEAGAVGVPDLIDIFLRKKQFVQIQAIKITLQDLLSHAGIEFVPRVLGLFQDLTDSCYDRMQITVPGMVARVRQYCRQREKNRRRYDAIAFHAMVRN